MNDQRLVPSRYLRFVRRALDTLLPYHGFRMIVQPITTCVSNGAVPKFSGESDGWIPFLPMETEPKRGQPP